MITQKILLEEIDVVLRKLKTDDAIYDFSEIVTSEELAQYIVFDIFYKKYYSLNHKNISVYEIAKKISEEENIDFENVKKQLLRDIKKFGERKNLEYSMLGEVPLGAFKYNDLNNEDRRKGHQLTAYQAFQLTQLYRNRNLKDIFDKDWNNNNSMTGKHIKKFVESLKSIYEHIEKDDGLNAFERAFQYYHIEQSQYLNLHMNLLKDIDCLKLGSAEIKKIIHRCKILKLPVWIQYPAQNRLINSYTKMTAYLKKYYYAEDAFHYLAAMIVNTSALKDYLSECFFDKYKTEEFAFKSYEWNLGKNPYLYVYPNWEKSSNIKVLRQFYHI